MSALDVLNERYGRGTVELASAEQHGKDLNRNMRQEGRTPRYTTHVDEMVVVRK